MKFINRERELTDLNDLWHRPGAHLVVVNGVSGAFIFLPLLLLLFLVIELLFDYILKIDFRSTALLWPYIIVYYLGLMGMVGYSFLIGKPYGFVTLGTYFLNLFATWYSFSVSGHG